MNQPPFRAEHIGSLLRPSELVEATARHLEGAISGGELRALQDRAVDEAVRFQESLGLKCVTDGEMRRLSYLDKFYRDGFGIRVLPKHSDDALEIPEKIRWIAPVHVAMYPPAELRRVAQPAPACPPFGDDSVLERSDGHAPGRDNVQPGRHAFGDYDVVWWDPRCLKLDVTRVYGIRREELIADPGRDVVDADRARYDAWLEARRQAQETGAVPTIRVKPVTEWTREKPDGDAAPDVTLVEIAAAVDRPTGPRFGTLVHAALATVALDANAAQVAESVALQARILGAPPDEISAATAVVSAALAHPLLAPAREAWRAGRCRRETPVGMQHADGTLLEGVLDIAWEDDDGWTVVDFKTDADLAAALPAYRRQVALYASAIARTTGRPVRAMLLRV